MTRFLQSTWYNAAMKKRRLKEEDVAKISIAAKAIVPEKEIKVLLAEITKKKKENE